VTLLRPVALAFRKALKTLATRECSSSDRDFCPHARLAVTGIFNPDFSKAASDSNDDLILSARVLAPSSAVSGSISKKSPPARRPIRSAALTVFLATEAKALNTSSPFSYPCCSLIKPR